MDTIMSVINWLSFHNKLVKIFTKEEFDWKKLLKFQKNHVVGLTVTGLFIHGEEEIMRVN